jgi:hypothetical protein
MVLSYSRNLSMLPDLKHYPGSHIYCTSKLQLVDSKKTKQTILSLKRWISIRRNVSNFFFFNIKTTKIRIDKAGQYAPNYSLRSIYLPLVLLFIHKCLLCNHCNQGDLALKPVQIISFPLVALMLPGAIGMFPWGQI